MNFAEERYARRLGAADSDLTNGNLQLSQIAVIVVAVYSSNALGVQLFRRQRRELHTRQVDPRVGRTSSGRALVVSAGPPGPWRFQRRQWRIARAPFCQPHQPTHSVARKDAPSLLAKLPTVYGR